MRNLLEPRMVYAPFEYPEAYDYWLIQHQSYWTPFVTSMAGDIQDWKFNLTESEKRLIGNILKGFTQSEVPIQEYWSSMVVNWFKKPEIQMAAVTMAATESIHTVSYAYLNQTLGLEDFSAFLKEPTAKAKIDRLIQTKGKSKREIARSLAIFSAFNEGVSLFASFAILFNFSRFNKMMGLKQIIQYSCLDEALHSQFGCWLFRTLIKENPEIFDDDLKKDIYDAARLTIELEDNFIDMAFSDWEGEDLTKDDMKVFIRDLCNHKLKELGLKSNWKNVSKDAISRMDWFYIMVFGKNHTDFFANRVTDYSKSAKDWSTIWV